MELLLLLAAPDQVTTAPLEQKRPHQEAALVGNDDNMAGAGFSIPSDHLGVGNLLSVAAESR